MTPYFADDSVTLYHGDALAVLRELSDTSVDCCVTSPPYYGLRDYGEPGQYGLESTPAEYVERMRAVFTEVRRVLAVDGTLWLNLGDSYVNNETGCNDTSRVSSDGASTRYPSLIQTERRERRTRRANGLPAKNAIGVPWRVAFALQDDGWILRNAVVWDKPNAMPESVTDRLSRTHEIVFLLAKSQRYFFDLAAIREPYAVSTVNHAPRRPFDRKDASVAYFGNPQTGLDRQPHFDQERDGRNPGDVWTISTAPFPAAHFAVMAPDVAKRCVVAGCRPGGTVLDPFCGVGTTGMVAGRHGRRFVGVDLSAKTLDLALRTRLRQGALIEDGAP